MRVVASAIPLVFQEMQCGIDSFGLTANTVYWLNITSSVIDKFMKESIF